MISTSQREHLTYTAIWQTLTIVGACVVAWSYVLPGYSTIDTNLEWAKTAIEKYQTVRENGMKTDELLMSLKDIPWKEELIKIIQAAPKETETAIKKEWKWEYLTWLKSAIGNSDEDKQKLIQAKQKINSILPTMSPIGSNIEEENITLKQYIKYIEWTILKTFDINSNIALGMQSIAYGDAKWTIPKNIGTFDLRLDFKATNSNIQKLINYVNNSWNPEILSSNEVITDIAKIPRIMSNPLLTIESLSLQDALDASKPNEENNGRVTIRFYVRGSSKEDITFLKWAIKERQDWLQKKITTAIAECKKIECSTLDGLEKMNLKYTEFTRSLGAIWGKSDDITMLSSQVNSIRSLEEEFAKLTPKI